MTTTDKTRERYITDKADQLRRTAERARHLAAAADKTGDLRAGTRWLIRADEADSRADKLETVLATLTTRARAWKVE